MDNYRIGEGRGVKSTSKWWGQATQLVLTNFFGYSFIYSHQITCDFALDIKHHKHVHCIEYGSLFHNYKLFSFTQHLPFAFSSWILEGGGGGGGCHSDIYSLWCACQIFRRVLASSVILQFEESSPPPPLSSVLRYHFFIQFVVFYL